MSELVSQLQVQLSAAPAGTSQQVKADFGAARKRCFAV